LLRADGAPETLALSIFAALHDAESVSSREVRNV